MKVALSFWVSLLLVISCDVESMAQCRSFKISDRGDTLNCVDVKGRKQGPWIVNIPESRGVVGYEEEGVFLDDRKEGIWRRYSNEGDLLGVENYKWGLINGKNSYYSVLGLEREESWMAIDPKKLYDTFDVPDLYEDGKYKQVIVKNEGRSLKHGTWTWYDPSTGFVQRSEEFFRDSAVNPLAVFGVSNKTQKQPADSMKTGKKNPKPDVVQEWEKKNAGKKKIKVRDGSTGY